MKSFLTNRARIIKIAALICLMVSFTLTFSVETFAQKRKTKARKVSAKTNIALPKVMQIDAAALKNLLKREGENAKPLLVNFWATWCVPCLDEFPELVKINADYKEKIDLIVVSLDDLAEIKRDVPKFLAEMKAMMPAYLLKTQNEEAAIASVSKDWQGGLPFTILFNAKGETVYIKQGKFKTEFLRNEIDKVLTQVELKQLSAAERMDEFIGNEDPIQKGKNDAEKDVVAGKLIIKSVGLLSDKGIELRKILESKYSIEVENSGCIVTDKYLLYTDAYNKVSKTAIYKKYGYDVEEKVWNEILRREGDRLLKEVLENP